MARPRDPRRDEAKRIWILSVKEGRNLKLVDLAKQLEVTSNTVRKWKATDRWDEEIDQDTNESAPNSNGSALKRVRGARKGNTHAQGNAGGAPAGNQNARLHGLYAEYLPQKIRDIMDVVHDRNPADMLWDQIQLMYANILHSLEVMYVEDKDDLSKEQTEMGDKKDGWKVMFAYEKQASFMAALARSQGRLDSMIRSYEHLTNGDEEKQLRLEKMKVELDRLRKEDEPDEIDDDGFIQALEGKVDEVWSEDHEDI